MFASLRRNQLTVDIGFTPILLIYAVANYQPSQLTPCPVGTLLWIHELNDVDLQNLVQFTLVWDAAQNDYEMVPIQRKRLKTNLLARAKL